MIQLAEIDHVVLRAIDLAAMQRFYCEVLGCSLERTQPEIGLVQLRAGSSLIDLVSLDGKLGRAGGAAPGSEGHNVDHLCLRVEGYDEPALLAHLKAHGARVGELGSRYGARGEGPSIYVYDPQGNLVELKGPAAPGSRLSPGVPDDVELRLLAERVAEAMRSEGSVLVTAESCTGGWIAKCLTDLPGSSAWFGSGLVTYSNESKERLLGVDPRTLARVGAVSEETAREMVAGALTRFGAGAAVAVTGIAGPGGGSQDKPVGLVWIGWMRSGEAARVRRHLFAGDREAIRRQSVAAALGGLLSAGT
jgi:glyoxylase I family protein